MISLTKAEMEDIWHNKSYGYWDQLRKKNKGMKKFKVNIQPCKNDYYEVIELVVFAKNRSSAFDAARHQIYNEYKPTGIDGYRLIKAEEL